jgi:hypothetical protein
MRLSTWRPGMLTWLESRVSINTYELRDPLVDSEVAAFLPPLRNIKHSDDTNGVPTASAVQDIFLTTRYPNTIKYSQLPLALTEGAYSTLCQYLLKDFQSIADLNDAYLVEAEQPIQVTEIGDEDGDWLITTAIMLYITWTPEPEAGQEFPGYRIDQINFNLYRSALADISANVLDLAFTSNAVITDNDLGLTDFLDILR